jgi:hypothetical protein
MWWKLKRQHDSRNILPCDFWDAVEEVHYYLLNKWEDENEEKTSWRYPESVIESIEVLDHWLTIATRECWFRKSD